MSTGSLTDGASGDRLRFGGVVDNEAGTARLAALLAPLLHAGDIVTLTGDLGVGKTAFARSLIRARTGNVEVPSPTFNLVLTYDGQDPADPPIWHFDLYRLENSEEAFELGIEEAFDNAISLIEWPDRLGSLLPEGCMEIVIRMGQYADKRPEKQADARYIEFIFPPDRAANLVPVMQAMGFVRLQSEQAGDARS